MTRLTAALIGLALAVSAGTAHAAVIDLQDWAFNVDGDVAFLGGPNPIPAAVDVSAFDITGDGLGVIRMTINGAGAHYVGVFVDHDVDDTAMGGSNTFFNELGSAVGIPAAGRSWEIDEPSSCDYPNNCPTGTKNLPYIGDIIPNSDAGMLDNQVFYDAFDDQSLIPPDDVSMAMGVAFTLAADEEASIDFLLDDTVRPAGFHLLHTDPDSGLNIYFSSALNITGGTVAMPEPATALLLSVAGLFALRRRRTR